MRDDLIETLRDCANALGELLPSDHAYRKIVEQANRLLDRHDQASNEQRAADALRGLMGALPAGTQTSMMAFRPDVNGQTAGTVKAFLMAENADDLHCAQWVIKRGSWSTVGEQIMNTEQERAEFEAWARKHGQPVFRDDEEPECYAYSNVQANWTGWQARAALAAQPMPASIKETIIEALIFRHDAGEDQDACDDALNWLSQHAAPMAAQPATDKIVATFRCESNGIVGTMNAPIHSVSLHDDGVTEVMIDHWPEQPAVGEEIMVNAAHDVYTLPLQPSGLSSGPRFVVHVPPADAWQPIETAPNEAWFLVRSDRGWIGLARRSDPEYAPDEGWFEDEHTEFLDPAWLTHWHPLPAPPATDRTLGKGGKENSND